MPTPCSTNLINYNSINSLYQSFIDGGSTETELTNIQYAQPEDMWELREHLLGISPHLSMDLLKEVVDRTDVFTDAALFDILAANPDELKKDELIKYLEDKENPLPEYMIDILREVANGKTYKTVLQENMSYYNRNKTRAAQDMIRSILGDSVINYNSLRDWLDNLGGIEADKQIISSYLAQGNFTDALYLANMLPDLYNLEGSDITEHGYYMDILNLFYDLNQDGRNTHQMDSTEIALLFDITESSQGYAGSLAKSILDQNGLYHTLYCPCLEDNSAYKRGSVNNEALVNIYGMNISVKPNPAKQWASFDFSLPDGQAEGTIQISNANGKIVDILPVSGKQGQILWDTRKIPNGMYLYILKTGSLNKSGKIVISN